ncbi:SRPBCC family protein [Daejeonella sp. H1SJ63]|uniref:SRPBCC family protein n=1 Tax=Daejeonella sp. H1SJ63 TaxID=3034145 RepID=UPI0023EBE6D0|nr:SRPBCC family protein [Daejeonella sp. H1SJ63]
MEVAWEFFSSPGNLARITPPEMDFKVLTDPGELEIYDGMLIDYTVKPLFGLPLYWQTEIFMVDKPNCFADRQLKGPYKLWEHKHTFIQQENGVLMKDEVRYQLPLGIIGQMAHSILVRKKVENIFIFRAKVLDQIFRKPEQK